MMTKIKLLFSSIAHRWNETYTKRVVSLVLVNSVLWLWASYILAFLGRIEIAEDLSGKVVTTILGTIIVYCLKSLFENVAQNGYKGKSTPANKDTIQKDI